MKNGRMVLPAVCLLVVAAWEVVRTVRAPGGVPGTGDWQAVSARLRAVKAPADWIVFAPAWLDPVGRQFVGDLLPWEQAGPMDMARFATIWEVSARGAAAPQVVGMTLATRESIGGLTLRKYQHEPVVVVADLTRLFASGGGQGGGGRVVPSIEEVDFEARRCLRLEMHDGKGVDVVFPEVALGRELVGYVGMADAFARQSVADALTLEVEAGGKQTSVPFDIRAGWVRFALATGGGSGPVVFRLRTDGATDLFKLVCLAAETRA